MRANLTGLLHFPGRLADGLNDEGDGAGVGIEVRQGERNPLAAIVGHHHHELARSGGAREQRVRDFEQVRDVGEILASHDLER